MKSIDSLNPRPASPFRLRATIAALLALGLPALAPAADPEPKTEAPAAAAAADAKDKAPDQPASEGKEAEAKEKADAEPAALEAAPGDFRNWFNVSVGGLIVDGNKAAAQRRLGLPASAFGGVEDFHFEKDIGKRGIFKVDGRSMFDNEDYAVRLELSDPEKGFVKGGFSQSREYYDGSGGW
ncbi:MAG: hypothetical protein IT580_23595, partial [Verrucomicrobiales bacterium]|nr:hypothetical protein [Verrucomicrobiales bacterium]